MSGYLLVDKPSGPTSYDIIRWIKPKLKGVKIGHTGTLDPLASGLLILLIGKATKQQAEFMKQDKTYRFRVRLGFSTDTGDRLGVRVEEKPVPAIGREDWNTRLKTFEGPSEQIPPMYSALKHEGQPLYKLARKGKDVARKPRPIVIYSMDLLDWNGIDELEIRARVSSGTYVRTLAEEIGKSAGTCAAVAELRREKIGEFSVEDAIEGEEINNLSAAELLSRLKNGKCEWPAAV